MKYIWIAVLLAALAVCVAGQTTEITYQGQLQSSSTPASGTFDFEFVLFDGGGAQIGPTVQRNGVAVAGGIFSVNLDFGAGFPGATRFLEIRVRQSGGGAFTTLSPRQPVTSAPYSIKSLAAGTADNATNAANAVNASTANTAGTATNFTGNLAGDVTGTQISTTVARLQSRTVAPTAPLDGQVLKFNSANNRWQPDTDNVGSGGGGGTITGVTPGTGLTGGGSTGNVTLGIGPGGVGTGQLAEGSVVDSKIVTVSGAKVIGQVTDAFNATNAANATTATNATQLGGVPANQYLQTNGNGSGLTNLSASNITTGTLANARIGQIATANIADAAITGAKIGGGNVVKTLNGLTDNVTLAAGSNITLTPSGNTLTIASTGGGGVTGSGATNTIPLWNGAGTLGISAITQLGGRIGIATGNPSGRLHAIGDSNTPVGVFGESTSSSGYGVYGISNFGTGVRGEALSGVGVLATAANQGSIALRAQGTSWFAGDTTPLSIANYTPGTGIVIGSSGSLGYISAFDYSANAPRTLLLNNSGGNVGIGTNTPTARLNVIAAAGQFGIDGQGGVVAVRGGTTNATGLAGRATQSGGVALATFGSSWFSGDSTPLSAANTGSGTGIVVGSAGTFGYMSAYDSSVGQVRTLLLNNGGGNVGINTNTPDQALSVNGNASKAGGGSWLAFSDERLKNIKGRFNGGLKAVMKLQPLRYEYKKDNAVGLKSDGEHVGFSAQAVEKIIPEAVTKTEQGYRLVNNDPIIWAMLNAIKEQQATIEKLTRQVRKLERSKPKQRILHRK